MVLIWWLFWLIIINYLEAVTSPFRKILFLLKKLSIAIGDGNGCSETFWWIGSLRNVWYFIKYEPFFHLLSFTILLFVVKYNHLFWFFILSLSIRVLRIYLSAFYWFVLYWCHLRYLAQSLPWLCNWWQTAGQQRKHVGSSHI